MAKKNYYAVKAGRKTGIFTAWDGQDGAKAQVIGFPGAIYKGFVTKEEAEAFLAGDGASNDVNDFSGSGYVWQGTGAAGASGKAGMFTDGAVGSAGASGRASGEGIRREEALSNLQRVVVANDVTAQIGQLNGVFGEIAACPLAKDQLTEAEEYRKLCDRYDMLLDDGLIFESHPDMDAVAFVDGGGDKSGEKQASASIPFGVVFFEKDAREAKLYRFAFSKHKDAAFDWIFHASNVSAEVIADLFVMYLCEKRGCVSVTIYQDNNLPAKYFSGEFKKIHNHEDYVLQSYMTESIRHLTEGMDIRYVYVPSEHSAKAKSKKAESYEAQDVAKISFETAEFYNALSDILADYRWEN